MWGRIILLALGSVAFTLGCGQGLDTARSLFGDPWTQVTFKPSDGAASPGLGLSADGLLASLRMESMVAVDTCSGTPAAQSFQDANSTFAALYTASSSMDIGAVSFQLEKVGSPAGNIWVSVHEDAGTNPGTQIADSDTLSMGSFAGTSMVPFSFSPPLRVESGRVLYFRLNIETTSYAYTGNHINLHTTPCGVSFGEVQISINGGATWAGAGQDGVMSVDAAMYDSTGPTLTYVYDAGDSVTWLPGSFTASVNMNGGSGLVDYEIEFTDEPDPVFTGNYQAATEIWNRPSVVARFLHVRARLLPGGPSDQGQAELGEIAISHQGE